MGQWHASIERERERGPVVFEAHKKWGDLRALRAVAASVAESAKLEFLSTRWRHVHSIPPHLQKSPHSSVNSLCARLDNCSGGPHLNDLFHVHFIIIPLKFLQIPLLPSYNYRTRGNDNRPITTTYFCFSQWKPATSTKNGRSALREGPSTRIERPVFI